MNIFVQKTFLKLGIISSGIAWGITDLKSIILFKALEIHFQVAFQRVMPIYF